jgi:hypothetical protein
MTRLSLSLWALGLVLLTGCAGSAPSHTITPTQTLGAPAPLPTAFTLLAQRPLHLPTLAAGTPCPLSATHTVSADYGSASGDGPAYPILGEGAVNARPGVLIYNPPHDYQSQQWGGQKVLWVVAPTYSGPVLIRGHQIDGPNELRFNLPGALEDPPPAELAFLALNLDPHGWSGEPSATRVRAAGCYAYQADGTTFSVVIIFQALPAS